MEKQTGFMEKQMVLMQELNAGVNQLQMQVSQISDPMPAPPIQYMPMQVAVLILPAV